ncbi:MAG TPA: hypothetical protein VNR90_04150 [Vicinamibacterales bacterium]|nr:hypothetical protein [Vicinamibacterales bacterium]
MTIRATLVAACAAAVLAQPVAGPSARVWIGHEASIEAQLRTAAVTRMEDIGTGVTRPRRAFVTPAEPVASLVWKVLPPSHRSGYWESYKSEIAAYELDKLLGMHMVPPAVERRIGDDVGAAVMWIDGPRSVKQLGGQVPSGEVWGAAVRRMVMFDNLIGNPDRNAGNILVGEPGEFILIDHSRAFTTEKRLPQKFERVDADLWDRITALTPEAAARVLSPWLDAKAITALFERRTRMQAAVDKLIAKKGRAQVVVR